MRYKSLGSEDVSVHCLNSFYIWTWSALSDYQTCFLPSSTVPDTQEILIGISGDAKWKNKYIKCMIILLQVSQSESSLAYVWKCDELGIEKAYNKMILGKIDDGGCQGPTGTGWIEGIFRGFGAKIL